MKEGTDQNPYAPPVDGTTQPTSGTEQSAQCPHNLGLQITTIAIPGSIFLFLFLMTTNIPGIVVVSSGVLVFADAWISGIWKRANVNSFVNISPAAWGVATMLLFIVAIPIYAATRRKLRTIKRTNALFITAIVMAGVALAMTMFGIAYRLLANMPDM